MTCCPLARVIFVWAIPSVENQAQIGAWELALIRGDAVFVLMSRSHVVDFEALTTALTEGAVQSRDRRVPAGTDAIRPPHSAWAQRVALRPRKRGPTLSPLF